MKQYLKIIFVVIFVFIYMGITSKSSIALAQHQDIYGNCGESNINTAIGCIPVDSASSFAGFMLRWAIGIGGGIAFLLILFASFNIMTSAGDPQRLKGGQELLTSAIAGLVMLIFSIFILRLVGVSILQIPGFGN